MRSEPPLCPRPTSSLLPTLKRKLSAGMISNSLLEVLTCCINWRPYVSWLSIQLVWFLFKTVSGNVPSCCSSHNCFWPTQHGVPPGTDCGPVPRAGPLMQPLSIPEFTPPYSLGKAVFFTLVAECITRLPASSEDGD